MSNQTKKEYSFLDEYISEIIKNSKVGALSEENEKIYLPQLVAQAEVRLGSALMPKLDDKSAEEFTKLLNNEMSTSEEWQAFWRKSVSDFDEVVSKILIDFAEECKVILAKI